MRVAFLDDELEQTDRITALLQNAGHQVHAFGRGQALLSSLRAETYELILLDWEVPDVSGYEVLRNIRTRMNIQTPVLFLTHRDSEVDVVEALHAGADDFLIKPARELELLARVEALNRRGREVMEKCDMVELPPFRIDFTQRFISRDGKQLELTHKEFEVAAVLFRNIGKVLSRGHIMEAVWGQSDATSTRTVDMHVSRVRQVLGLSTAIGLRLTAIYGYGYRLERTRTNQNELQS